MLVNIVTNLLGSVFHYVAKIRLKGRRICSAAGSVEGTKLIDSWIALRICEGAEKPVDRTTSMAAFVTVADSSGAAYLLVKRESGGVIASLRLSELAVVPIGKGMIALVDLPSITGSSASRRLAIESAAILWFEDDTIFPDIVKEFCILTSCPMYFRAYIFVSLSLRRFFR